MTVLAHMSDLHLDGGSAAADRVRSVVDHLAGLPGRVDAVLVTGDLADHGTEEEYREARAALAPLRDRYRVLTCPGNHDSRPEYRAFLLGLPTGTDPVNEVHEIDGVRVLMCDSSIPGRSEGELAPATLHWLDTTLAAAQDQPAFVALHHPPVPLGLPYLDRIGLREPQALADVLARHPQVAAVLCGHAHTAATTSFAGRPLVCAPGIASTALPPWEQGPDDSWKTHQAPPALTFHLFHNGHLTSHVRAL
ncbi:phosphodiesterase [Streptomyces alkaliterrae]|uniref:Phosphodiesterase n=2 Tax=Streptomyces alkaliterrae TaxID=2213162 RepID=A0A5P0YQ67_9ACTN|nr:phosphodiesterase [Streptomyces alkaliterrae]MBB1257668.1 phosphodiesterase [Streptomyces alkaliterrae]MQS01747.1 phosphodiesterase [Streptomyces alkaliterrae]